VEVIAIKNLPSNRASRLIRARSRARTFRPMISAIIANDSFTSDPRLAIFRRPRFPAILAARTWERAYSDAPIVVVESECGEY